ncbi:hypothetical protein Vretimale_16393 [Volvox reticuliferus]|nr:hypothetical protein Vretimale_16393 [Volvox reticuliferus]
MPPNPRESQLGDGDEEPPPRPPETVFVQIVKAYLKDDLLIRARRFKTAGSTQAKFRSQLRTAPHGLWLSSKSLTAGATSAGAPRTQPTAGTSPQNTPVPAGR